MDKPHEEWLRQADYDMDTAEFMLGGGRCFYAVFMCHLSIEKALKGLYHKKLDKAPPKTHNLMLLLNRVSIRPPKGIDVALASLNEAHIPTRYPEEIGVIQQRYPEPVVRKILDQGKETLEWIKKQL